MSQDAHEPNGNDWSETSEYGAPAVPRGPAVPPGYRPYRRTTPYDPTLPQEEYPAPAYVPKYRELVAPPPPPEPPKPPLYRLLFAPPQPQANPDLPASPQDAPPSPLGLSGRAPRLQVPPQTVSASRVGETMILPALTEETTILPTLAEETMILAPVDKRPELPPARVPETHDELVTNEQAMVKEPAPRVPGGRQARAVHDGNSGWQPSALPRLPQGSSNPAAVSVHGARVRAGRVRRQLPHSLQRFVGWLLR